jgi:hypothetical protein
MYELHLIAANSTVLAAAAALYLAPSVPGFVAANAYVCN